MSAAAPGPVGLAFKAKEIEELADVYFFRPFGYVFAALARALGLSPSAVTVIGTFVGIAGAVLLATPRLAVAGFFVIILHSVLDSSDGQLARMTGQTSEFGRILDGVGGYLTHIAIYAAILSSPGAAGNLPTLIALAAVAGLSNVVHSQMYDYHRSTYVAIAVDGRATSEHGHSEGSNAVLKVYESMERALAGRHREVEAAIARRSPDGRVTDADRQRYRSAFYWPVRGWNVLGDNTRFYALGVLALVQHVEWFFVFVAVGMNAALAAMWWWQARVDRQFLRAL